jgi:uncharacterized protein YndB with AHSA1/START domain
MTEPITVEVYVHASIKKVWSDFTDPEAMKVWNTASDDWHTTKAENDLRVGGDLTYRMEAKDGSAGFDLMGTYTEVIPHERIAYTMGDGRKVAVVFEPNENGVQLIETFDPETENTREMQQGGWQAILDNFKKYTENDN